VDEAHELWERHSRNRLRFMDALYRITGGRARQMAETLHVFASAGIPQDQRNDALLYLMEQGLVTVGDGSWVELTPAGLAEFEESMRGREAEHLPPVNILNVHTVIASQIQQGTSNQRVEWLQDRRLANDYKQFVVTAHQLMPDLRLRREDSRSFAAQVETIEGELMGPKPRLGVLRGAATAANAILTSAATTAATQELLRLLRVLGL
jgi:hypothetical protein